MTPATIRNTFYTILSETELDWELGNRRIPEYLFRLMEYKLQMEKMIKKKVEN